ncbi:MAG: RIP metalloprotease RseP [Spirochaetales bacterium]|nr:RIP metalloprotease RseP [Spirochaetales bacterium]
MNLGPLVQIFLGLLGLTVVITVHELGHLLAARLFKVEVLTFSIGIGKKLIVLKGKKTEWALSLLPLGGYCRLKGEQNFIQAWEEKSDHIPYEEGSLFSAPWWQRVIIALAGPAANLIFGALLLSLVALIRYPVNYVDPIIVPVSRYDENRSDWPADKAGLQTGDRITSIDGEEVSRFSQIQEKVILEGGNPLSFTVERNGEEFTTTITPELNKENGTGYIGVYPFIEAEVKEVGERSIFSFLSPGERIITLNGGTVECTMDFYQLLDESDGQLETITTIKDGETREYDPHILIIEGDSYPSFPFKTELTPSYGLLGALKQGTADMSDMMGRTVKSLGLLFKGIQLNSALSGPLRISWMTGEVALSGFGLGFRIGLNRIIQFLSLICAALAFANLLPIPVLDGGQVILYFIDGIRKKALTPHFIYYYQMVGTVLVITLALFASANDILFFLRS